MLQNLMHSVPQFKKKKYFANFGRSAKCQPDQSQETVTNNTSHNEL